MNKKLYSDTVSYVPDDLTERVVRVRVEDKIKSERDENEWYIWNISLDISHLLPTNGPVEYVVYRFAPKYQDRREDKRFYDKSNEPVFSINVIGWQDSRFEIELKHVNGSISKMVSRLKP